MAPQDLATFDYDGFAGELDDLKTKLTKTVGQVDLDHARKMERWSLLAGFLGYSTAWIFPNPISAMLISIGIVSRFTILNHHVAHRAFDRIPGAPARFRSATFARGWRRFLDWPDWIVPEAWNHEHNVLHHHHTGEVLDPDVVEDRSIVVRGPSFPKALVMPLVVLAACTWRFTYYAPNTLWLLQSRRPGTPRGKQDVGFWGFHGAKLWSPFTRRGLEYWVRCLLLPFLYRFVALPALFLPLGVRAAVYVLLTSMLAEVFANLHTFAVILPNHTGEDLCRFPDRSTSRGEFYLRQVLGSVNFYGGTDRSDFMLGWLNYQIEHHLWQHLPPLKLRDAKPEVQAICRRYGVPYIIEPVTLRLRKTIAIIVGHAAMKRVTTPKKKNPSRQVEALAEQPSPAA